MPMPADDINQRKVDAYRHQLPGCQLTDKQILKILRQQVKEVMGPLQFSKTKLPVKKHTTPTRAAAKGLPLSVILGRKSEIQICPLDSVDASKVRNNKIKEEFVKSLTAISAEGHLYLAERKKSHWEYNTLFGFSYRQVTARWVEVV